MKSAIPPKPWKIFCSILTDFDSGLTSVIVALVPSRLVNLEVSSELLEPDNVIEGKKSLLEILRSDFDTLIFSLSAFNSGLF